MLFQRADDPRLGEVVEFWQGNPAALRPGRAVIVGFPHDQGVKRNRGRVGAARAPHEIRQFLHRLCPWDSSSNIDLCDNPPLELGNVPSQLPLEDAQQLLGQVVGALLAVGAIPVVLGGGHETAFGHYLGYVTADRPVGIINIDAHLDVRPCLSGLGHSGSPFRQAMEHLTHPLPGSRYVCLGAQPFSMAREHWKFLTERGGKARWADETMGRLVEFFQEESAGLAAQECTVLLTVDADAVSVAEVPGVSAPNVNGLSGRELLGCVRCAGRSAAVGSFEVVEINPALDRDGQSARWAALLVWQFLMGLGSRSSS
jgi:formiminoglutamase